MKGKIINVDSQIDVSISDGYCTNVISINKAYKKNDSFDKSIRMIITDDITFRAFKMNIPLFSKITELKYEISIEDKIFFALNRLLGVEQELYIDDDNTKEEFRNYLLIKRENNKIVFIFHDEEFNNPSFERFSVFIKNTGTDVRSKMDDLNTKYKISLFFKEASEIVLNENHQYTFDEYYEILKSKGLYNDKNPFIIKTGRRFKNAGESCLNCFTDCNMLDKNIGKWCSKYVPKKVLRLNR